MTTTETPPAACDGPPPTASADDGSLATLVRVHQHMVWRYLRLLGASATEADDLMQDTLVRFASGQRRGEVLRDVAAFLRGVARNLLLAARRRSRRSAPAAAYCDAVDALATAEPDAFADARLEALRHCLQRLPDRARTAIQLHHLDGLSRRDVAQRLGLGDEGAKSLLSRARELLRQCVDRHRHTEEPGSER
jgi:RNA polymerase sigma-70 factor (ECF subfamily)